MNDDRVKDKKDRSLILSISAVAILAILGIVKVIVVDRYPIKSFLKKETMEVTNIVDPNLAKNNVKITIASKAILLENPQFILVEDKDGKVIIISSGQIKEFDKGKGHFSQNKENISNQSRDYFLQDLILQAVTISGNAYAGHKCLGPYTNANGEIVPRTCPDH